MFFLLGRRKELSTAVFFAVSRTADVVSEAVKKFFVNVFLSELKLVMMRQAWHFLNFEPSCYDLMA